VVVVVVVAVAVAMAVAVGTLDGGYLRNVPLGIVCRQKKKFGLRTFQTSEVSQTTKSSP
jgi:hypothetical protein